jgi:hypothetical protein
MQRDARSYRRPATAPTPRWRGLPPTSPRSRVAGPRSGSSATRAFSIPHWIETRRYRARRRRGRSLSAHLPGGRARPAAGLRGQVRPSDGLWGLGRMAALRTRPCDTSLDRRRAARVRHHEAARPGGSADRSARRTRSAYCPISRESPPICSGHCPPPSLSPSYFGR